MELALYSDPIMRECINVQIEHMIRRYLKMDVKSKFVRHILNKIVKLTLKRQYGVDIDLNIKQLDICDIEPDKVRVEISASAVMTQKHCDRLIDEGFSRMNPLT